MAAPVLEAYEYQYKDNGTLINGSALPFWDVEHIKGLTDQPEIVLHEQDLDGQHGSIISAKYFKHRSIVIDGILYATTGTVDTVNEAHRTTILPDGLAYPFHFKHPGLVQRYVEAKPVGYNADVETGRRTGKMPYQMQYHCEDPRMYSDNATVNFGSGVAFNMTNSGNTDSFPIIKWTAASTATIAMSIIAPSGTITFSLAVVNGQTVEVNLKLKLIKVAGLVRAATVAGTWPRLTPGTTSWTVNTGASTARTVIPRNAWL